MIAGHMKLNSEKRITQEPPVALVKTWYHLLVQNEDKAAKTRAAEMLRGLVHIPSKLTLFFT
jgi:hypothetical protein